MEKNEILEYFIDRDILELYGDFSDDGDGELELTDCGDDVAELIVELVDKAREEERIKIAKQLEEDWKDLGNPDGRMRIYYGFGRASDTYIKSFISKLKE